jgi:MFS family permease
MAYWFYIRFHEGPGAIGPMMAVALFFTAFSALGTGWLTGRFGVVRAVVWMRFIGLACLFILPFAPSYGIAATVYILRSFFNRGTAGARQALSISLVRPSRRGLAASLGSASLQIPRAAGPMLAGLFFDAGFLVTPFLIAGVLQTLYLILFRKSFLAYDPSRAVPGSDSPSPV